MKDVSLAELTVAELLQRWPQAIPVFLRRHMACVGCTMAPFETLADVTAVYGMHLPHFLNELQQVSQTGETTTAILPTERTSAPG